MQQWAAWEFDSVWFSAQFRQGQQFLEARESDTSEDAILTLRGTQRRRHSSCVLGSHEEHRTTKRLLELPRRIGLNNMPKVQRVQSRDQHSTRVLTTEPSLSTSRLGKLPNLPAHDGTFCLVSLCAMMLVKHIELHDATFSAYEKVSKCRDTWKAGRRVNKHQWMLHARCGVFSSSSDDRLMSKCPEQKH